MSSLFRLASEEYNDDDVKDDVIIHLNLHWCWGKLIEVVLSERDELTQGINM